MDIELYNLDTDPSESNDASRAFPEVVKKIAKIMEQEHEPSGNEKFKIKEIGDL